MKMCFEILEAGINVNTTLNIQHIESLNDIVQTIEVRERIPDKIVNLADEVEVVDISASNLTEKTSKRRNLQFKNCCFCS